MERKARDHDDAVKKLKQQLEQVCALDPAQHLSLLLVVGQDVE